MVAVAVKITTAPQLVGHDYWAHANVEADDFNWRPTKVQVVYVEPFHIDKLIYSS